MDAPAAGPPFDVPRSWAGLMDSMNDIAEDYQAEDWSTTVLHPGTVVTYPAEHDQVGFVLVVADNEFAALEAAIDGEPAGFDSFDIYRRVESSAVLLILAIEDNDRRSVVLLPAIYEAADDPTFEERAVDAGQVTVTVRTLTDAGPEVSFVHEDPDLFFPEDESVR